jgi:SAM-dependent methyltransferase
MPETPFLYDVISYPGLPQPQTHPARLAAIGRLHGVPAASPAGCRFLEIGCGDGASLLPLALAYSDSMFLGMDLAESAIGQGEACRRTLGLENLTLVQADLTRWQPPPGEYDYIVAHGFYSWVPSVVRDALLRLCQERLTPAGIAYISYNALPGCHIRRMLWEMLQFHVRDLDNPAQRIEQSVALLQFLAAGAIETGPFAEILRTEVRNATERANRAILFHDDLSPINHPVTITQFMEHASPYGLEFLGEAEYFSMTADLLPPDVGRVLAGLAERDRVLKEQYLDFLKVRQFRQTLLCRQGMVKSHTPLVDAVTALSVTSNAQAEPSPVDVQEGVAVKFRAPGGAAATFDNPFIKAAFVILAETFPYPLPFSELCDQASRRAYGAGKPIPADPAPLARVVLESFRCGLAEVLADPPRFARAAAFRPRLSPLARLQLEEGREVLTSLRPSIIRMENLISREMLRQLDGKQDRAAILSRLVEQLSGDPRFLAPGDAPKTREWWQETIGKQLEPGLAMAAKNALLVEE